MILDTTVQQKNITYPTDVKLWTKVVRKVWDIAKKEGIKLRQSYRRTLKKLLLAQRFAKSKEQKNKAVRSARGIRANPVFMVKNADF